MAVTVTGPYTVSGYAGYIFYKFTGAGSVAWTKPDDLQACDVTVIGGGAGGKNSLYAGAGAGYCNNQTNITPASPLTVVVGNGGEIGMNGGQSAFGSYTANGGNTITVSGVGGNGGSGGGSKCGNGGSDGSNGETKDGTGGTGQGTTTRGCDGVLRCGGGGGYSTNSGTPPGSGGAGGGGTGGRYNVSNATPGTADYGGGGGGGSNTTYTGGAGGSGIVIVRYIPKLPRKKGQPHVNSGGMLIV